MKTLQGILLATAFAAAAGLSAAPVAANQPGTAQTPAPAATTAAAPACKYMLVPHPTMPAAKAMRVTVACTPEMLKNDPVCQRACGIKQS